MSKGRGGPYVLTLALYRVEIRNVFAHRSPQRASLVRLFFKKVSLRVSRG